MKFACFPWQLSVWPSSSHSSCGHGPTKRPYTFLKCHECFSHFFPNLMTQFSRENFVEDSIKSMSKSWTYLWGQEELAIRWDLWNGTGPRPPKADTPLVPWLALPNRTSFLCVYVIRVRGLDPNPGAALAPSGFSLWVSRFGGTEMALSHEETVNCGSPVETASTLTLGWPGRLTSLTRSLNPLDCKCYS